MGTTLADDDPFPTTLTPLSAAGRSAGDDDGDGKDWMGLRRPIQASHPVPLSFILSPLPSPPLTPLASERVSLDSTPVEEDDDDADDDNDELANAESGGATEEGVGSRMDGKQRGGTMGVVVVANDEDDDDDDVGLDGVDFFMPRQEAVFASS